MSTLAILIDQQDKAFVSMRGLLNKAAEEKRELTAEEEKAYEGWENEFDALDKKIERERKLDERGKRMSELEERAVERPTPRGDTPAPTGTEKQAQDEQRTLLIRKYLQVGERGMTQEEMRGLVSNSDPDGGYFVPEAIYDAFIKNIDDDCLMRQLGFVLPPVTNAKSLGYLGLDTDVDDADWTVELETGSETTLKVGKRAMEPHPFAKRVKVSNTLLRQTSKAEALVLKRLSYKFAITEEKAFLNGDGVQKPLGIFTATSQGMGTDRDITGSNTTTAIAADTLFDVFYGLKTPYAKNASWLFSRPALKMIRKLKDSQNQYLWEKGFGGAPGTIIERPYYISEYVPQTFTAGLYVGAFADFKQLYWIVDALGLSIQRLDQLYAETNQTGFIGRQECDGMPVLPEAGLRIALAAS